VLGYVVQQSLGSGSFANVFKGVKFHKSNEVGGGGRGGGRGTVEGGNNACSDSDNKRIKETVAIKAINRKSEKITKKVLQNLELEISILRTYKHPNIVSMNQVHKTDKNFFLILEYCAGGDLQRLIRTRKSGRLTERLARRLMRDLTSGLTFLARQQLIHRDIKPQNLLLTGMLPLDERNDPCDTDGEEEARRVENFPSQEFHLKIADFGFARHLQKTSMADTLCGSPLYMAPEILQHKSYDNKADLWSAGTVLFEMIAGRPPFHGENHIDLLRNIQQKAVRLPPNLQVSRECVKLLRILLNRNPLSRADFKSFIEASNAFVALGCNGTSSSSLESMDITMSQGGGGQPFANLGPISEEETHQQHQQHQQQLQTHDRKPSPSNYNEEPQQQQQTQPQHGHMPGLISSDPRPIPHFSPLEPSPPGPKAIHPHGATPPPMPLGNDYRQIQNYPGSNINATTSTTIQPHRGAPGKSESSQNSDDSEFVMVEKGLSSASSSTSPTASSARLDDRSYSRSPISNMWKQSSSRRVVHASSLSAGAGSAGAPSGGNANVSSSPVSPRSNSSRFFSGKTILSSRNLIPPAIPFVNKGMLSTSPGTGGALVGMMGNVSHKDNAIVADRGNSSSNNSTPSSSFMMPQNGVFNYELFARMLAAAEDVGRRAINVAHVGDTRAYLAMKLIIANENLSSLHSSGTPMEGVVEECGYGEDRDGEDGGNGGGCFGELTSDDNISYSSMAHSKRGRAVSTDQMEGEDGEDEDDEMPFAMPSSEDEFNSAKNFMVAKDTKDGQQHHPPTVISSVNSSKTTTKTSNHTIQVHFREALSCYIKSLTMLKGSVNASQRILVELNSILTSPTSNESESINQFKKRCETSHGWLAGQFKGVLERAEAGKVEVSKLSSSISSAGDDQQNYTSTNETTLTNVEELIYNHSLACGRDGAVKQLLGQHDAARACYRSAGLLVETLLMEPKLVDEDKKALESYVQGFAERISELDCIMLNQNRQGSMVASGGSVRRGSSIIPVIGGLSHVPKLPF